MRRNRFELSQERQREPVPRRTRRRRSSGRRFGLFTILIRLVTLILGGGVVAAILYVGFNWTETTNYLKRKIFVENPYFTVDDVSVRVEGRFPDWFMSRVVDLPEPINIYAIDADAMRIEQKRNHSWIERFDLTKQLPNRVRVFVKARSPVAELKLAEESASEGSSVAPRMFIDEQAIVFKVESEAALELIEEPTILVESFERYRPGYLSSDPRLKYAVKVLDRFELSSLSLDRTLEAVDLRGSRGLRLILEGGESAVFLGAEFDINLEKWARILKYREQANGTIGEGAVLMFPGHAAPYFSKRVAEGN